MHIRKKALLAAGLLAGAAALSGCSVSAKPVTTPTPLAAQQRTPDPATAEPAPQTTDDAEEAKPEKANLIIGGKEAEAGALKEADEWLLPLVQTAEKLGWKAKSEQTEEETQTKRVITLEKDDSRITVSWTVSDNTAKNISWQKDGLLIPVDARITTMDETVYVPAAFFEEAMDVSIAQNQTNVIVSTPKPADTPKLSEDSSGENG